MIEGFDFEILNTDIYTIKRKFWIVKLNVQNFGF